MKKIIAAITGILLTSSVFAVDTNWVRLGQTKDYIVDINTLSIEKQGSEVKAVNRIIPRSSVSEASTIIDKGTYTVREQKPTFIKLSQATFNCSNSHVTDIRELLFDTNMESIGENKRQEFGDIPEEYKMISKYVCK